MPAQKRMLSQGQAELREVRARSRSLYWLVGIFSMFANLLMLTGPLYMLQVYDRVLSSRSVETLIALSLLVMFLYAVMGLLDYVRTRIMSRVGAQFQSDLDQRVFDAVIRKNSVAPDARSQSGLSDLETVQRMITSPILMSFYDLPWTPVFMAGIFLFNPMLGWLAVVGAACLIIIALANQWLSMRPQARASSAGRQASLMSAQISTDAEMVRSMGMSKAAFVRWQQSRSQALKNQIKTVDVTSSFTSLTKALRLFLQSAMLGAGAYLVLQNELTPGAMIAGSILLGRALAPVEQMLGQWTLVQRAWQSWGNLAELLGTTPPEPAKTALPVPQAHLVVKALTVIPPGEKQASLRGVTFEIRPGEAMGIIGFAGAGKSTLARCLTGVWRAAGGSVRLDSATLDQYPADVLGTYIGYLPQRVQLFDGTIAENIARLSPQPDDAAIVAAAQKADAHEMILALPDGYDTRIVAGQQRLSGGQIQRIGLARALYLDPVILVLDEPNSNLDSKGSEALNKAVRTAKAEGRSVLIMAHRPSAIRECDTLLILEQGASVAFGPRDQVLEQHVRNHKKIQHSSQNAGGVA